MKKTTTLAWLGAVAMLLASAVPVQAANVTLTAKSVTPAVGTVEASQLSVVTITFDQTILKYNSVSNPATKCYLNYGTDSQIQASGYTMKGRAANNQFEGGTTTGLTPKGDLPLNTLCLLFENTETKLPTGQCTLTILANTLSPSTSTNFNKNNEFTLTWTIKAADPFASATSTLDPAVGERTSLKDFTVTYSGLTGAINGVGNASDVTLSNGEGTTKEATGITYTDNSFTVSFDEITTPGKWTLNIPEGTALIDDAKSPAISPVTYTIPKPANPFAVYVITPEAREAYSLSQFEVAFPEFSGTPTIDSTKKATLNGVESTSIALNDGKVVVTFSKVTKADTYTLSIPAGTVSDGTNANELIETTYTIINPLAATPVLDPEEYRYYDSLSSFHVTYPDAPEGYIATGGSATAVTLVTGSEINNALSVSFDADRKGFTVNFKEVKKAGSYKLTIPAGTVFNAELTNSNELIQADYFIRNPFDNYQITPQSGTTNSSLKEFVVSYPSFTGTLTVIGGQDAAKLNGVSSTSITANADGKSFTVTFPEFTKAGTYSLEIPDATVSDGVNSTTPISGTYTIADPFANPTITPADGKHLNTILEVSVTFPNAFPEGTTLGDANTVTLTDGEGISVNAVRVIEYENRTGYDVIFDQISEDGTYTVNIPAGFLKYADNESAALQATYTIQKPIGVFANYTSEPAEGDWTPTSNNVYIYISFPDITEYSKVTMDSNPQAIFSGEGVDGTKMSKELPISKKTYDVNCLTLQVPMYAYYLGANVTALSGFYELTLPAGTFNTPARTASPEINLYYVMGTATGVEAIEAVDGGVNVYDLTGRQLLKDADASELRTLANGLYIVNGKKVLLRR